MTALCVRRCEHCGNDIPRRTLPNGHLEYPSFYNPRRFCGRGCATDFKWAKGLMPPAVPNRPCTRCGKTDAVFGYNPQYVRGKKYVHRTSICNPCKYIHYVRKRFHQQRTGGKFDTAAFVAKTLRLGSRCQLCGAHATVRKLSVDHIIPVSKGGTNSISNLQPLCLPCNIHKRDKMPYQLKYPVLELAV